MQYASAPRTSWRPASRRTFPTCYVNLGIGMPTAVANHISGGASHPAQRERRPGHGAGAGGGSRRYDLINAGKQPVSLLAAAPISTPDSFAMMRGGHLDICVLGAFQVSATGDLANWSTASPATSRPWGAMDLLSAPARPG